MTPEQCSARLMIGILQKEEPAKSCLQFLRDFILKQDSRHYRIMEIWNAILSLQWENDFVIYGCTSSSTNLTWALWMVKESLIRIC